MNRAYSSGTEKKTKKYSFEQVEQIAENTNYKKKNNGTIKNASVVD